MVRSGDARSAGPPLDGGASDLLVSSGVINELMSSNVGGADASNRAQERIFRRPHPCWICISERPAKKYRLLFDAVAYPT